MIRERLIEIYEAELRRAFDDMGDDFDLCHNDIDFTDDGAVNALTNAERSMQDWASRVLGNV